jgi:hypothetical protein
MPGRGLATTSDEHVLDEALAAWRSWHRTPPACRPRPGIHPGPPTVEITNRDLLLYYQNRTAHVGS